MKLGLKNNSIGRYTRVLGLYYLCLILGAMNIGSVGSLLKILGLLPVGIWAIENHTIRTSRIVIAAFLYVFICGASILWSLDFGISLDRTKTQIAFFILLVSAAGYSYCKSEIGYLKTCLIWSSRITAILVLVSSDYLSGRIYLNSFVREDPNYLCGYFMFGIAHCLIELLNYHSIKKKLLLAGELLLYIYIIFATGSRGGLFADIIVAAIIIIKSNNYDKKYSIFKRCAVVLLMIGGYFWATSILDSNVMSRYTLQAISESNGTGRYELWLDAIRAFTEFNIFRQFLGYGTGATRNVTYIYQFHRHNVLHNMFIDNLIEIGLVGVSAYTIHIFSFLVSLVKREDVYCVSILIGMIVLSLSTSIYAFKPYWNIMLFIVCLINCNLDENKENAAN